MQVFERLTGHAIPLDIDNVDTDMIIPAQFLTSVNREGYGEHLFKRLRDQDIHFIFNDLRYQNVEILLTKANFGCGSSREHAVWAILQAGIKVIIAESYSDIFYNNAAKNGLLTISLEPSVISELMKKIKSEMIPLIIDLAAQTITTPSTVYNFEYDPFRKDCFLKGQDDLDYLLEATA